MPALEPALQLYRLFYTGVPLKWTINATNRILTPLTPLKKKIVFNAPCVPILGEILTIEINDEFNFFEQINFTFSAFSYTNQIGVLPMNIASSPNSIYLPLLVDAMLVYPGLAQNYSITAVGDEIIFESKVQSSVYDFSFTGSFTGLNYFQDISIYSPQILQPNYKIIYEVLMENSYMSNEFERLHRGQLTAFNDEKGEIEVSDVLKDGLERFLSFPFDNLNFAQQINTQATRRFVIKTCEYYGNPPTQPFNWDYSTFFEENYLALLAGRNEKNFYKEYLLLDYPNQYCLSYMPSRRKTYPNQLQYVSVVGDSAVTLGLQMEVLLTYIDGSSASLPLFPTILVRDLDIITFGIGPQNLNLASLPNEVQSYRVNIKSPGSSNYIREFIFDMDCNHYEFRKDFLYFNSFGQIEVITFTGHQMKSLTVERKIAEKDNRFIEDNPKGSTFQFAHNADNTYMITSGNDLSNDEINILQEFLFSDSVYEILEDNSLEPITILTNKFKIFESKENIQTIEFEYRHNRELNYLTENVVI